MSASDSSGGPVQNPPLAIDSVLGRIILTHMVEHLREQREIANAVAQGAVTEIDRLSFVLRKVIMLCDRGNHEDALAMLMRLRKEIEASLELGYLPIPTVRSYYTPRGN